MSCFVLVLHENRATDLAVETIRWLVERDHEVRLCPPDAERVGRVELGVDPAEVAVGADLVVSLGGDGTMLRAADLAVAEQVPVMGVNLGNLGYLTEVEPGGIRMALKRFLNGAYQVEERMRLGGVVVRTDGSSSEVSALNELVIEKSDPGRTVRLDVELDGRPFTSLVADGLILATPTGSTAYAFSVRGPIIDPTHRAVLMAPVAAHMLFDRAMVLRPDGEVTVTVAGERGAVLSVDGRPLPPLSPGDRVSCSASEVSSRFVTFGEHDFHAVLRSRFGLSFR